MANRFSILAWKFHGQRSQKGCSLWGTEESNMTEWLTLRYWVGQNVHSSFFVKCYVCTCANSLQSCLTPWNPMDHIAHQASLSMAFSEHEWSGLPCPPPGDLSDPGIKPMSLTSPALAGRFFTTSATWEALHSVQFSPLNILVFPALVHQNRSRFALIQEIVFNSLSPMNNRRSGVQVFLTSLFL